VDRNRRRLYSLLVDFYYGKLTEDYFEDTTYRKVYRKLYFEIFRHLSFIEKSLALYLKKDTPVELYAALTLGASQILFMNDIPDYAAVNETLNILKPKQRGFVNAVLRKLITQKDEILKNYSIYDDFPEWYVNKLKKNFGEENLTEILYSLNNPPLNNYIDLSSLTFYNYENFEDIPAQALPVDRASALIPLITKDLKVDKIMDACAAPGGKTVILSKIHPLAEINAFERDQNRARKLNENVEKYKCTNVKTFNADVLKYEHLQRYDLILLDAPCSSLGTIKRHPEVRFLRNQKILIKNSIKQLKFLTTLSDFVKIGGFILYSVCSNESEEGVQVINNFLKNKSNFEIVPVNAPDEFCLGDFFYSVPHKTETDGFFAALLKRVA
jgi:16S rRNA (cytosine967-C5)-methyltransferase